MNATVVEGNDGLAALLFGPCRRENCARKLLRFFFEPQIAQKPLRIHAPVRAIAEECGDWTARPYHRISICSLAGPKFQPISHQSLDAQVLGQRTHHMIQPLAD